MINQNYIDLMNLDLDNEITHDQKIILNDFLNSSEEGRNYYEELSSIAQSLSVTEKAIPSENIKKNIINSIDHSRFVKSPAKTFRIAAVSKFLDKKFVLSFGAGTAAILIFLLLSDQVSINDENVGDLSGSLTPQNELLVDNSNVINLDKDGILGTIKKNVIDDNIYVEFNLTANQVSELQLDFDQNVFKYDAIVKNPSDNVKVIEHEGNISIIGTGKIEISISLKKTARFSSENDLFIRLNGKTL